MMMNPFDINIYRSILCLNGHLPDALFFQTLNLPVIAADGAANTLDESGISPMLIIGDLDSVHLSLREKHHVLYRPDQNSSDFQKSLHYLKDNQLLPAIVVGINGGYLDHILNNINIFLDTNTMLYAPPLTGYVLKEPSLQQLSLPLNTKISILGIPFASVSSKGLKWELSQHQLSFPGATSCFNRTVEPDVFLEIHQGSALILIYEMCILDNGFHL